MHAIFAWVHGAADMLYSIFEFLLYIYKLYCTCMTHNNYYSCITSFSTGTGTINNY